VGIVWACNITVATSLLQPGYNFAKVCVRSRVSMYLGTRLHVHVNKRSDAVLVRIPCLYACCIIETLYVRIVLTPNM